MPNTNSLPLRPYQQRAKEQIHTEWEQGRLRTLLVLPTGTGKTIVFVAVAEDQVRAGDRVLILAHRGELLEQAADQAAKTTGGLRGGKSRTILPGQLVPRCRWQRAKPAAPPAAGKVPPQLFQHHHH